MQVHVAINHCTARYLKVGFTIWNIKSPSVDKEQWVCLLTGQKCSTNGNDCIWLDLIKFIFENDILVRFLCWRLWCILLSLGSLINLNFLIKPNHDQISYLLTFSIQILGIQLNHPDKINKKLSQFDWTIQIWSKKSQNPLKMVKINKKGNWFCHFWLILTISHLFIDI